VTLLKIIRSRDSSLGVATRTRTKLSRNLGSIPCSIKGFSFFHSAQTGTGTEPVTCTGGTWCSLSGVKRSGCKADSLPPSSSEVKNAWTYTTTSPYIFMVRYIIRNKDNNLFLTYNKETAVTSRIGSGLKFWPQGLTMSHSFVTYSWHFLSMTGQLRSSVFGHYLELFQIFLFIVKLISVVPISSPMYSLHLLFLCGFLYDAYRIADYIASKDRMIDGLEGI
jgi:hypothetical protein